MSAALDISLPRFAGPLDLLLELVRKQQVEITDIPIAEITRQYLQYLAQAKQLDVVLTAEFTYMAATLIQIKSKCLLPRDPKIASREEDPRQELVRQLLDYQSVREAAEFLREKLEISSASWSRSSITDFDIPPSDPEPAVIQSINLIEILELAKRALDTARTYEQVVPQESVTIEQQIDWLLKRLKEPGIVSFEVLWDEQSTLQHRIALFLAALELAKANHLQLEQAQCFGPIHLNRLESGTTVP